MNADNYTCKDYREEMILVSLRLRLNQPDLSDEEKKEIIGQILKLEQKMKLD